MRSILSVALLAGVAMCAVSHPDVFLHRHRGGSVFKMATQAALHHQAERGLFRNSTANFFTNFIDPSDHSKGTFQQRYFVDSSHWNGEGPAMLYISGEAPSSGSPWGYPADIGANFSAIMFTVEHRFYGESMPANLTDKAMLKYLTIENALEDFAYFTQFYEKNIAKKKLTWFVVGGSYAGAVSAWSRLTHPEVFVASWSSSGVVNPLFNFFEYDAHIQSVIDPDCTSAIQNVWKLAAEMFDDPSQRDSLYSAFGLPSYFTKEDILYMIADASAGGVQYGMKSEMCNSILPQQASASAMLQQYNNMIVDMWGTSFASNCGYSTACLSNVSMSDQWQSADYAWIYQTCSQFAWWQIGFPGGIRSSNVSTTYFADQCKKTFWNDIIPDTFKYDLKYGGAHPNATKVIALQGSDDPWQTAGVRRKLSDSYVWYYAQCSGCGHCGDLSGPSATTPEAIKRQHEQIQSHLSKWVLGQ